MLIETEFDGEIAEDLILEDTDHLADFETTLKNSENILKSALYLKKMLSSPAIPNEVIRGNTIDVVEKTEYPLQIETNIVLVKNVSETSMDMYINDGRIILLPFETFEFPVSASLKLAILGKASIIETKYKAM